MDLYSDEFDIAEPLSNVLLEDSLFNDTTESLLPSDLDCQMQCNLRKLKRWYFEGGGEGYFFPRRENIFVDISMHFLIFMLKHP